MGTQATNGIKQEGKGSAQHLPRQQEEAEEQLVLSWCPVLPWGGWGGGGG